MHTYEPYRCYSKMRVLVEGRIVPNGTNAPSVLTGEGFTVSRVDGGHFRVTFDETVRFVGFSSVVVTGQYEDDDTDAHEVRVTNLDPASKSFDIQHLAAADTSNAHPALADLTANGTAITLHFQAVLITEDIPGAGYADEVAPS